jgi:hypothetical protein
MKKKPIPSGTLNAGEGFAEPRPEEAVPTFWDRHVICATQTLISQIVISNPARLTYRMVRDSKQISQRQRLAPVVFLEGFSRHAANHIAFLGKAFFSRFFVGPRRQNWGAIASCSSEGRGSDLLQEPGHGQSPTCHMQGAMSNGERAGRTV